MLGEERFIFLIHFYVFINNKAFPLIVLAEPNSKSSVFKSTLSILEKTANEPLAFLTEDFDGFKKIRESGAYKTNFEVFLIEELAFRVDFFRFKH